MDFDQELETNQHILNTARGMVATAITAPKAKGINNIQTKILIRQDIAPIIEEMEKISSEKALPFFKRDAENLKLTPVLVLIGTKISYRGIPNCGFCGNVDCSDNKAKGGLCSYDITDLGIAIGQATAFALNNHVDHRVFFTAGKAAINLKILEECKLVYAIPLSVYGKNIYYDRG